MSVGSYFFTEIINKAGGGSLWQMHRLDHLFATYSGWMLWPGHFAMSCLMFASLIYMHFNIYSFI